MSSNIFHILSIVVGVLFCFVFLVKPETNSGTLMKSYEDSITPALSPQTALKRHTLKKILCFRLFKSNAVTVDWFTFRTKVTCLSAFDFK